MHHSAASYGWALCKKRVRYTPAEMDVDELIGRIRCSGAPIHKKTLAHMGGWMNWLCSQRRSTALLRVGISDGAKHRHIYTPCTELPVLGDVDYRGVILIRAPMGSGKTKGIGLAFSRFAQYSNTVSGDARFVAIVHRVTLVSALVQVLGLTHYRDGKYPITKENAVDVTALGVCLPSINKASLRAIMKECRYLLIDEIAQVLAFLESKKCFEEEGEGSRQAVYGAPQSLIRNATCVIGMDAGVNDRVIKFIEQCRPAGEQIRIYDMAQKDEGLTVKYGYGQKAIQMFYEEANRRLGTGEKLWIGCDSRKQATELHEVLSGLHGGKRFLLITLDTTDRNEQRAFLENADRVSREYDCVIHSPSISSGLSIEHKRKDSAGNVVRDENRDDIVDRHFDHCMFIGSGCSISAADALQMMRRVRYVKTWTVAIYQDNTGPGQTDPREIIAAWEQASAAEGKPTQATPIGRYFAGVEADSNGARIEFANELYWLMEQALFKIERTHQTEGQFDPAVRKEARLKIEMREKSLIVAARDLSNEEAGLLERSANKSDEDRAALERHEIAGLFGSDVFNIAPEMILDAPL
ncbi:plasmid replication protein, CyRepA1 family [Pararobbsia alpina]|nr:plasmid replication protein, CyRepA1 family [Pararobbsia alpina]